MIIPGSVKVGNYTYDVNMSDDKLILNNRVCYGYIDYEELEILIDKNRNEQSKYHTFLHELLHAITYDKNLDLGENEEHIIDEFAKGLHGVLLDNPRIFEDKKDNAMTKDEYEAMSVEEVVEEIAEKLKENSNRFVCR